MVVAYDCETQKCLESSSAHSSLPAEANVDDWHDWGKIDPNATNLDEHEMLQTTEMTNDNFVSSHSH